MLRRCDNRCWNISRHRGTVRLLFLTGWGYLSALVAMPRAAVADTLWYNGDFNGNAGYLNAIETSSPSPVDARMFERFDVTDSNGWNITTVWSDNFNLAPASLTQAEWSIRTGMGTNNAGTILFGGTGSLTATPTGRAYITFTHPSTNLEYQLTITGLNIYLSPGQYWLNVTPYSDTDVLISSTTGANAIGTPTGTTNPGLWWFSDGTHNYDFVTPGFSMGVGGRLAVPEPSSLLLTGVGALLLGPLLRRRWGYPRANESGR